MRHLDRGRVRGVTEVGTGRSGLTSTTDVTRMVEPRSLTHAGFYGRYWARTSDPQLVELVLSQLS